jgi:hypothetical protein
MRQRWMAIFWPVYTGKASCRTPIFLFVLSFLVLGFAEFARYRMNGRRRIFMHKAIYVVFAMLSASILIPAIGAQTAEPPKHGVEHEKLAYFLGKWVYEEDVKTTAYSRSGKYVYTELCEWFAGEFAIVCHSYYQNGAPRALSIVGYDSREKTYTYFQMHSNGESGFQRGTIGGDTWTWTDDSKTTRGRFTEKTVNADMATYTYEMSRGSEPWVQVTEGKQTRQK